MYDIAHAEQKKLYKEFGVNAEYLINHSWGKESCTIADIKAYKPKTNSISNSQILFEDYSFEKARLVLKEMVELGSLRLIESNLVTDTVQLYIGYSKDVIKATGGTQKITTCTNVYSELLKAFLNLYDRTTNRYTGVMPFSSRLARQPPLQYTVATRMGNLLFIAIGILSPS